MQLTTGGKKLVFTALTAFVLIGGYMFADSRGLVPGKASLGLIGAKKMALTNAAPLAKLTNVPFVELPSNSPIGTGTEVRIDEMGWNSQLGLNYANGGAVTTKGSLMEKNGVTNLKIIRQDNCDQQVN